MPLLFQGVTPVSISYGGKNVRHVYYNGSKVWSSLPAMDSLENMSWEDIALVCRAGMAQEYWQPGDTKCLTPGDSSLQLQIIGFNHDPVSDSAAYGRERAGITLQLLQLSPALHGVMNTTNYAGTSWHHETDFYRCAVRASLLPAFLASSIPSALKNVLVPVNKAYIPADDDTPALISDTLFLPSLREILGSPASGHGSEGTQYAYYAQGRSPVKKTAAGAAAVWWTRSPTGANAKFYQISASGAQDSAWVVTEAYAPACMCI